MLSGTLNRYTFSWVAWTDSGRKGGKGETKAPDKVSAARSAKIRTALENNIPPSDLNITQLTEV